MIFDENVLKTFIRGYSSIIVILSSATLSLTNYPYLVHVEGYVRIYRTQRHLLLQMIQSLTPAVTLRLQMHCFQLPQN